VDRNAARAGPPVDGESDENTSGAGDSTGRESGLPGLHAPVLPRPAGTGPSLSGRGAVSTRAGAVAGEAATSDAGERDALARGDGRGGGSAAPWLEGVLPLRVSASGLPLAQPLRAGPVPVLSPEPESPPQSPVAGRREPLCGTPTLWAHLPVRARPD